MCFRKTSTSNPPNTSDHTYYNTTTRDITTGDVHVEAKSNEEILGEYEEIDPKPKPNLTSDYLNPYEFLTGEAVDDTNVVYTNVDEPNSDDTTTTNIGYTSLR